MRKWTYLVAALLMGGVSTSLTSCIDNDEPAGITDLRGAKAELLRAKAAVEQAEAQKKIADAAYTDALTAIQQEKAKQQALLTELLSAKTDQRKQEIQQEMALSAEKYKAELYAAQQNAAQAEAAYKKALIDIELQMLMYKEDQYADALTTFLTTQEFTYTIPIITIEKNGDEIVYDENGIIKYTITDEEVKVAGYYELINRASVAKNELAKLNTELLNLTCKTDLQDLKKENTAYIAYYQGLVEADKELVAKYKDIQGTDITGWETKYNELKQKIEDVEKSLAEKETKLAEDKAPINAQITDLQATMDVRKEVKFTFDVKLSEDVYDELQSAFYSALSNERYQEIMKSIELQTAEDAEGNITLPNGLTLNLSPNEINALCTTTYTTNADFNGNWIWQNLIESIQSKADKGSANNIAQTQQAIKVKETNAKNAKDAYDAEYKVWNELMYGPEGKGNGFLDKANAYGYKFKEETATNKYDSRNAVIKEIQAYQQLSAEDQAKAENIKTYATKIATYLSQRYELDGFNPLYTPANGDDPEVRYKEALKSTDATTQKAALASFISAYNSNPINMIGEVTLTTNEANSLYTQLTNSTKKIWGSNTYYFYYQDAIGWIQQTIDLKVETILSAVVSDEWDNQDVYVKEFLNNVYMYGSSQSNFYAPTYGDNQYKHYRSVVGDGLANDYFASAYDLAKAQEELENTNLWEAFAQNLTEINTANQPAIDKYNTEYAKLQTQLSDLDYTYQQETAELNRTKDGYEELGTIMKGVINKANNSDNLDIEPALEALKNKIIDIEGGLKVTTIEGKESTEYVVGSIAENEAWINYYTNINKLIDEGKYDFESGLEQQIALKNSQIDAKETEIEVLTKLVEQANEKKDALLKGLTGESSTTTPAE